MSIKSFFVTGAKRPREEDGSAAAAKLRPPLSLCAWNANSLANRVSKDGKALAAFLDSEAPDVIFVSEVRMPAQGPPGCKKDDGKPRRRTELARGTAAQAREADELGSFLRSHGYRAYYSLSDSKYSGAALLVRRDVQQPVSLRFSLDLAAPSEAHHADGRVIVASFEAFELLGTYAPNNGTTAPSFERRREWDAQVTAYLRARRAAKPLVWIGDLNVAAAWDDVGPSPEWFRTKNGQEAEHADDRGQPGFTSNEQRRFRDVCAAGRLTDAYRLLHPAADWAVDATWRGAPGVHGPPETGRYYNKGMRIDYVLVEEALAPRVRTATVCGRGAERDGFIGSDHCPLVVTLAEAEGSTAGAAASSDAQPAAAAAAP